MRKNLVWGLVFVVMSSIFMVTSTFSINFPQTVDVTFTQTGKAAIIYGYNWNSYATSFVATNFNLLIVDLDASQTNFYIPYAQWMTDLRSKSSSIQIFGYKDWQFMHTTYDDWGEVDTHEDWFVHDASGNRILYSSWGTYLMDVGNAEWRQHWVSYVNNKLGNCSAYDGIFADNVWDILYTSGFDKIPNDDVIGRWHNDTLGMLQYVRANLLLGKKLIVNTEAGWALGHINYDYLNVTDGMLIEGYSHAPWEDSTSYTKVVNTQIDCLAYGSANGKIMIAESGSTTDDARLQKLTYAQFLLGANGSTAYWGWNTGGMYYNLQSSYQPMMDTKIGTPTNTYYNSQGVYMRDFTNGKVISNPTCDTQFVDLGGTFWLLDNMAVSALILDGYSAEIVLNAPIPPPSPSPTMSPSPIPSPSPTLRPTSLQHPVPLAVRVLVPVSVQVPL